MTGKFYRMIRRGNGWIIQELDGATGICKDLGDWDLREVTERKVLNVIIQASGA